MGVGGEIVKLGELNPGASAALVNRLTLSVKIGLLGFARMDIDYLPGRIVFLMKHVGDRSEVILGGNTAVIPGDTLVEKL